MDEMKKVCPRELGKDESRRVGCSDSARQPHFVERNEKLPWRFGPDSAWLSPWLVCVTEA